MTEERIPRTSTPMSADTPLPEDPQALRELLVQWFARTSTPTRRQLLGFEYECLRIARGDASAAPSLGPNGPDDLLRSLARHAVAARGPEAGDSLREHVENDQVTVIEIGSSNFSLEPGGQIEISLAPYEDPLDVASEIDAFAAMIRDEVEDSPYRVVFLGHQPLTMPQAIALRAKPRYEVMNRRLAQRGSLGIHMMRATAGMQVTLDSRSADDCASLLRAALMSAPIITAIYANSPLVGGRPSGYLSYREAVWWDTDPTRCGIPVACLDEDADLGAYVDWALDAEPWFVRRDGELREVTGHRRFRDMLGTEWAPTLDDFSLHSTTLFPSARLRGGVEVRSADCVPTELAKTFCALFAGLAYDEKARDLASRVHDRRDAEGVRKLHACAARHGLDGRCGSLRVRAVAEALVDVAKAGLTRQVEAGRFSREVLDLLTPLEDLVRTGVAPARELLDRYEAGVEAGMSEEDAVVRATSLP
ncbi:MAG: hypothetical protein KDC95_02040 [Planctomycetes bacterium]|nr:hypothetical protein [Planctomycetota bacterium]